MGIKVCNAALDETPAGDIVLRGVIDPESLCDLQVAPYQREVLPITSLSRLIKAIKAGVTLPDIELGMRGERFIDRAGCFHLQDEVFIVDGLQRVSAAMQYMLQPGDMAPNLGATVHFSTTEEWERNRFKVLNADRTKLSSNVLLRNLREDLEVIEMLYRLSEDKGFVLGGRICWQQKMTRGDVISALAFAKVVGMSHSHLGPTRHSRYDQLAEGLQTTMETVGKGIMRDNAKAFFELVDSCWGIRRIAYTEGAAYMRHNFLMALAEVVSGHTNFWRDGRLFVEAPLVRKIKLFPVADPNIQNLASSSGKARQMLVLLLIEHINSGKRTKRLRARKSFDIDSSAIEDSDVA